MKNVRNSSITIEELADQLYSKLQGWINYYGRFRKWTFLWIFRRLSYRWCSGFWKNTRSAASKWAMFGWRIVKNFTQIFSLTGDMVLYKDWNDKSRMMGDYYVRFCERLGLKCLAYSTIDGWKEGDKCKFRIVNLTTCKDLSFAPLNASLRYACFITYVL